MRVEAKSEKKLRMLRMGRGGEFTLVEFGEYCAARRGAAPLRVVLAALRQNGVVERRNQTVISMARI